MRFWLFMALICGAYYFLNTKEQTVERQVAEVKATQKTAKYSWNTIAIYALVVVIAGGAARTIFQSKSRRRATNEMYNQAKTERVVGYDHGTDEGGKFNSIITEDAYGTNKYYTIVDTDEIDK